MNIAFRADASRTMGGGHVMRCLTLADALAKLGATTHFACRELVGHHGSLIQARGHRCTLLGPAAPVGWERDAEQTLEALGVEETTAGREPPFDWIVADHYGIDHRWERVMRRAARRVMVIDDLADREHDCELLLDQNLWPEGAARYAGKVPPGATVLVGPKHALLKDELLALAREKRERRAVGRVLVSFGGTDPHGLALRAAEAIAKLARPEIAFDLVAGSDPALLARLRDACRGLPNANIFGHVESLHVLMHAADLSLGSGGATTWERCALGLPALVAIAAQNQRASVLHLESLGALRSLGDANEATSERMARAVQEFLAKPADLAEMSRKAAEIMEGATGAAGVARLVSSMPRD